MINSDRKVNRTQTKKIEGRIATGNVSVLTQTAEEALSGVWNLQSDNANVVVETSKEVLFYCLTGNYSLDVWGLGSATSPTFEEESDFKLFDPSPYYKDQLESEIIVFDGVMGINVILEYFEGKGNGEATYTEMGMFATIEGERKMFARTVLKTPAHKIDSVKMKLIWTFAFGDEEDLLQFEKP